MGAKPRKTYRHGNLEKEAADIAFRLVEQDGHEKLSLRKIAGELGVAHRAIYNHYENRDALLNTVATRGFNELADKVERTRTAKSFVAAYLNFAVSRAHLYTVMTNRPHASMKETPALQTAVHRVITKAWAVFGDPAGTSAHNRKIVMAVYMLLHGGATQHGGGVLDVESDTQLVSDLTEMAQKLRLPAS